MAPVAPLEVSRAKFRPDMQGQAGGKCRPALDADPNRRHGPCEADHRLQAFGLARAGAATSTARMRETTSAALKTVVFTVIVPGTVTIYLPLLILSRTGTELRIDASAFSWAGLAMIGAGVAGYLWCVYDFTQKGRGTPAPIDPPKELVASGLYRYTRNPMYVSVLTILLGEAMLVQSLWLALHGSFVAAAFQSFIVFYEEPALRRSFGSAYERFCERVPRWLF